MNAPPASSRVPGASAKPVAPAPGLAVRLLAPRAVAGRSGIIRRPIGREWEIEFRTPLGTPMHVVLRTRQFVVGQGDAAHR